MSRGAYLDNHYKALEIDPERVAQILAEIAELAGVEQDKNS